MLVETDDGRGNTEEVEEKRCCTMVEASAISHWSRGSIIAPVIEEPRNIEGREDRDTEEREEGTTVAVVDWAEGDAVSVSVLVSANAAPDSASVRSCPRISTVTDSNCCSFFADAAVVIVETLLLLADSWIVSTGEVENGRWDRDS
jgi:hypothetical protein